MNDLIDKQALLEEIENGIRAGNLEEGYERYPNINNMDDIIETIRYADVVQPERKPGRWIPCSERLPENKTYVLTTIHIPGRQPHARSGWYEDGLFMNDNGDTWKSTDREVKAWMPLPEPYRGGETWN